MKKREKKTVHKNLILRLCVFAFAVYAAMTLMDMQVEITARRQALDAMRKTNEVQRMVNKDLKRRLEDGVDAETIERLAREKLDYVYPEEKIFIDISGS